MVGSLIHSFRNDFFVTFSSLAQTESMKICTLFIVLLLASTSAAQIIEGALVTDGRKVLNNPTFLIEGMKDGWAKFELAVDINGNVTSVSQKETNLRSTPATMLMRDHVKKFKFEAGTMYPVHHHVIVKITMVKGAAKEQELEIEL